MTNATDQDQEEGLAGQASAKVQDATSAAQEKASELREQGSARLRGQFDQRSNQAGSQARSLAEALRRSGNDLHGEGSANVSQLTGQAADRIERLGGQSPLICGEPRHAIHCAESRIDVINDHKSGGGGFPPCCPCLEMVPACTA